MIRPALMGRNIHFRVDGNPFSRNGRLVNGGTRQERNKVFGQKRREAKPGHSL